MVKLSWLIFFQIFQVVRKLADEQAQYENGGGLLTISSVYDAIKHSNSSLKRRNRRQLEDAIDRVLLVLREEHDDSESLDGDFEGLEDSVPHLKVGYLNGGEKRLSNSCRNIML